MTERKRSGERMIAVFLSLILAIGMFWVEPTEAEAADSISVTISFTMEGLEETEEAGIQGLTIDAHRTGSQLGMDVAEIEIEPDNISQSRVGNQLTYTCSIEGGPYRLLDFFIVQNGKRIFVTSIGDDADENHVVSSGSHGTAKLCRFCFMSKGTVWYEQYAVCSMMRMPYLQLSGMPQMAAHNFLGWTREGEADLWNFNDMNTLLYVPTTFYAVWEHPDKDTWTWNYDNGSHWHECSCGDKADIAAHIEDNGRITKEPSETENGIKTYLCKDCGYTMREEVLPQKGKPTVSGNDSVSGNDPVVPSTPDTPDMNDTPVNPDKPVNDSTPAKPDVIGSSQVPADGNVNTDQDREESLVNTSANAAAAEKNKEPKTGDTPYVEICATIAMIAGMAYLLLHFRDDARGMSEIQKQELVSRLIAWAKRGGYFRRIAGLAAIFCILAYYHSIGKKSHIQWKSQTT